MGLGGHKPTHLNQTPNTAVAYRGSKTTGDNLRGQKGNSPDRQLRSQNIAQWKRKCSGKDSQEVGLEAAIPRTSA